MSDAGLPVDGPLVRVPAGSDDLRTAVTGMDVTVAEVGPTGVGGVDPLVTATLSGRTALFPDCSADTAADAAATLAEGDLPDGDAVVEHDGTTLPVSSLGGLDVGSRRVLGGCGWRRPTSAGDHAAAGGFVDADPGRIREAAADLRGRGWGDWCHDGPVGDAWQGARGSDPGAAVVVNAHATPADALLVESVPFEPLEGAMLVAEAVDAAGVVVYVSEADERAHERARAAADAYPDPAVPIDVITGPPVYRAAEPTMALEAIEGNHRLEARLRTGDLPTLEDAPALVHTARTCAHLAVSVRTGEAASTRLVTVSGDVEAPATVELPETAALDRALDAVAPTDGVKAACVGGRFGGLTPSLDVENDPDALSGADLGTEGTVELLGEGRCVLAFAGKRAETAAETNCGRCVPCREGSKQLADQLRDVYDGDYDESGIEELVRVMDGSSVCAFGVQAGRPARTAIADFGDEVRAHAKGDCPAGSCSDPAEVY